MLHQDWKFGSSRLAALALATVFPQEPGLAPKRLTLKFSHDSPLVRSFGSSFRLLLYATIRKGAVERVADEGHHPTVKRLGAIVTFDERKIAFDE